MEKNAPKNNIVGMLCLDVNKNVKLNKYHVDGQFKASIFGGATPESNEDDDISGCGGDDDDNNQH